MRNTGLDALRLVKATRRKFPCDICRETINRGDCCYRIHFIYICKQCRDCWEKEGGNLWKISRRNKEIK